MVIVWNDEDQAEQYSWTLLLAGPERHPADKLPLIKQLSALGHEERCGIMIDPPGQQLGGLVSSVSQRIPW